MTYKAGLGTASTQDVGTSANNVVQLDASSRLPAVDGSQLINLPSSGGLTYSAITTNTSAQVNYHYSATGTITITLPAASGTNVGEQISVKNRGTGTITISRSGSDTIDGVTSYTMSIQYEAVSFISNGSNGYEIV